MRSVRTLFCIIHSYRMHTFQNPVFSVCAGNAFLTLELLWAVMRVDIKRSGRVICICIQTIITNAIARRHNDYHCCIAVSYNAWDSGQYFFCCSKYFWRYRMSHIQHWKRSINSWMVVWVVWRLKNIEIFWWIFFW